MVALFLNTVAGCLPLGTVHPRELVLHLCKRQRADIAQSRRALLAAHDLASGVDTLEQRMYTIVRLYLRHCLDRDCTELLNESRSACKRGTEISSPHFDRCALSMFAIQRCADGFMPIKAQIKVTASMEPPPSTTHGGRPHGISLISSFSGIVYLVWYGASERAASVGSSLRAERQRARGRREGVKKFAFVAPHAP